MVIRNINGCDMDKIIALWKKTLPYLCIDRAIFMRKVFLEANFTPKGAFVAEENGKIIGFVNAVFRKVPICADAEIETKTGWISAFVVDKNNLSVGDELLDMAEKYLKENGKTVVNTGYYPTYFVQGVDERYTPEYIKIFERRGYKPNRSIAMILDLEKYNAPLNIEEKREKLRLEGITFSSLTDEYITKLFSLENDFLKPSWLYEYKNRALNMDFDRIKIAIQNGKIIGACIFDDPDSDPGRFGPFGVNNCCQGKGVGGVLLADCLTEMKNRGIKNAWMQWASDDMGASILYERAGFVEKESYIEFEKDLL